MTSGTEDLVEALRNALLENERLRRRNKQLMAARAEPIAIVGMACRFPGEVNTPDEFWQMLSRGEAAIDTVATNRGWTAQELNPGDQDTDAPTAEWFGGKYLDAGAFDSGFFGISPAEALAMDPQQRLLLEISWEALERAGIVPATVRGHRTGVFVGAAFSAYALLMSADHTPGNPFRGNSDSLISGRVSFALGLDGPALTVDTACSSALVALHLAGQALRSGECTLALAGGAAVMGTPGRIIESARDGHRPADGQCKSFGAEADSASWSEGAGVLVLERLTDARRNGHQVLAVIKGSAVNQVGASGTIGVPSDTAMQRVIRAALAAAGTDPVQVDAVEGHGSGTQLGDPIEAQAIIAAYGQDRPRDRPLWLGSVKSNIGHAQAAAGVAGIMKMVLALRHQVLPRTLHADQPSPYVDWSATDVRLLTEPEPWPATGNRLRRAGINAYGLSGTNAHVILEEAPAVTPDAAPGAVADARVPVLAAGPAAWLVSGPGEEALRAQAARLAAWSAGPGAEAEPRDVAWSLATTRTVFADRAVVLGTDSGDLTAGLAAVSAGDPAVRVVSGRARAGRPPRAGFVFTGSGAPRAGLTSGLCQASPVFAAAFDEARGLLAEPAEEVTLSRGPDRGDAARAGQGENAQAELFAFQIGLVAVLAAGGITPAVVAGYSGGEAAAAYTAGVLSLAEACALVAARARLARDGGPGLTPGEFDRLTAGLTHGTPRVPWAVPLDEGGTAEPGPDYWSARARRPAEPAGALAAVTASGAEVCFGIGQEETLTTLGPLATAASQDAVFIPLLRRETAQAESLLTALSLAHVHGIAVDWAAVLAPGRRVELPTYAFQHQQYWPVPAGR